MIGTVSKRPRGGAQGTASVFLKRLLTLAMDSSGCYCCANLRTIWGVYAVARFPPRMRWTRVVPAAVRCDPYLLQELLLLQLSSLQLGHLRDRERLLACSGKVGAWHRNGGVPISMPIRRALSRALSLWHMAGHTTADPWMPSKWVFLKKQPWGLAWAV